MFGTRTPLALVTGLVVGAASAGSVAVAATSTGKQVTVCALKTTGAVRLATRCHKTEKPLKLGQVGPIGRTGARGPAGAGGPAGPQGIPGATGATGPSDVYSYSYANGPGSPPSLDATPTSTLFTVPPGAYLLSLRMTAQGYSVTANPYLYCYPTLTPSGQQTIALQPTWLGLYNSTGLSVGSGSDAQVVTLGQTTGVAVLCSGTGTQSVTITNFSVQAVRVGAAHTGGYTPTPS